MANDHVDEFEAQRPRLFALAYRLLGSAGEAEDAVQETFLRWDAADRDEIRVPVAWLTKVVTNLCLNRLDSARARRENYVGVWLPEPVLTDSEPGPLATAERRESVSLAMLHLLERLTPPERAVFVLREAFSYPHREIAEILDITESSSQQLLHRASRHLQGRPRFEPSADARREVVERFLDAARGGDIAALERLLADEVVAYADGGGKAKAGRYPVLGSKKVARYMAGWLRVPLPGLEIRFAEINGQPGILGVVDDRLLIAVLVFDTDGERIHGLHTVANPDKLAHLGAQLSLIPRSWNAML
ncbi:RNA polymerase sigma-70 factor [Saccharopolyspora taberi]|uniref:RNA polymerase sigma factor SigJ n=1 Tax=Saccharopolyspora taberi TaxID=60895 RepID=A0ABN3V439_9PSEU